MGKLTLFCLSATEDSSSLYGVAYGYNETDPTVGQLVILVRADVSAPTPVSLSSLTWSLVGLVQRSKVMSIPDNSQYTSTCAVSSGGAFTFLSPNVISLNITGSTTATTGGVPGGFRYDPTLASGLPNPLPPPSTANCNNQDWNNLWRFITVDANVGWNSTATQTSTYASLFYIPKAANSTGFGATENLVLSHLNDGTVYFAQEDNTFNLHHTGTLRTPTSYISSITTYTNNAGNFYLVGPSIASSNVTTVLGIPIVDGYLTTLPTSANLKVYSSTPGSIPASFIGGCAGSENTILASVTLNTLFYFCLNEIGQNHTLFSIPNVLSDSLISPPTIIPKASRSPTMFSAVKNFVSFSSPTAMDNRHPYGVLFGGTGIFGLGLDPYGMSDMDKAQTVVVSSVDGAVVTNPDPGNNGGGGSSGGKSSGKGPSSLTVIVSVVSVVLVVVVVAVIIYFHRRSKARRRNQELENRHREEQKGDGTNIPSPPLLKPRPPQQHQLSDYSQKQKLHFLEQAQLRQEWTPEVPSPSSPHSPVTNTGSYTPKPFQSPLASSTTGGSPTININGASHQEQFIQELQLSDHPRPNVVRVVTNIDPRSTSPQ